jgi:DNA-binding HxlR family transcriptional regulator
MSPPDPNSDVLCLQVLDNSEGASGRCNSLERQTIRDILGRVGDTWSILVVGALRRGPVRFNDLRRTVGGISQRMLTRTLRGLERDGIVERAVTPTKPPQVSYALTPLGRSLLEKVFGLALWVEAARADIEAARSRFDAAARSSVSS